ncbi:MAG TPA: hypothetical protein VGV59_04270 [Pyrinomonadaceae bacterium]|nr:hypothetical protein [Pyrinomonadaceae bacterium]
MSYSWSFHSFSDEAFHNVFGRSSPEQVSEFLELAASDLGDLSAEIAHASRSMLMSGISYDGVSPQASRAMDEVLRFAFSPEGLEAQLEVKPLSPDGIHPAVIAELVRRLNAPTPLLAALLRGRRYGQAEPADCEYCIFRPDEVSAVLKEIRNACAASEVWSAEYMPDLLQECLIEPFEVAVRAGRPVFCVLS